MGTELSRKDRTFADRFFGGPNDCRGNAARCYKHLYPQCKDSTAETNGPRLLRKAQVREYLDSKAQKLREETDINAKWVLEEAVRLYRMAMGDTPTVQERIVEKQDEDGNIVCKTELVELRKTDLRAAVRALWLIGKHTAIQAFSQKVEVKHTHRLEQILAKRSKQVEERATNRKLELVK